ncbi:DEAD/DEAH box helicase [Mariniblastus sp.]|nr:DEAD/DEAH box helicase [Mariniblastus sp.]
MTKLENDLSKLKTETQYTEDSQFTPGMRVLCRDAEWLVTRVEYSDYTFRHHAVHCIGADDLVRGHEAIFLTQLDTIEPVDPRNTKLVSDNSSGFRLSQLFLEAQLRQMPATGTTPDLVGMGAFKPMAFQTQAAEFALKQLRPRLLLADAVGLGKTIQVGMILSELIRRGRANRIAVLAKKSMLTQFQSELWNRFGIPLVRLDSAGIAKLRLRIPANKNPFEVYHRVIISIDTLKNIGNYRHFLENARWDCVVIDEAHNVAGASGAERNLSYRLARLMSRKTDSMLLTTATPHNGKRETFGRLISLLDPSAIPDPEFKEYTADDIKGFFFMRFKEDVRDDAGEDLTDREVIPLEQTSIAATQKEEVVYEILGELRKAAKAGRKENDAWKHHALMQYGIYKQFLSSPESCLTTIGKRADKVEAKDPESPELPFLKRLNEALAEISIRESSRYKLLLSQLKEMGWNGKKASPRVLIFTEYRETQDALAAALAKDFKIKKFTNKFEDQRSQVIATVNGSCPDTHLMKIVEAFGTGSSEMRMLVATDVASEGVNLHYECHNIIHYDLPWSIITLIQRNGRVDRIGQRVSPVIRYLHVETKNGLLDGDRAIFERLVDKVEEINKNRQSGESVLKIYDPEKEAEHIAKEGIVGGNKEIFDSQDNKSTEANELESILADATPDADDDFLDFIMGDETKAPDDSAADEAAKVATRFRLFGDRKFLQEGYRYLAEQAGEDYPKLEEHENISILTAPLDLRRRLGASDKPGDVVFGATAIPSEAWPDNNQFKLTDDPERVATAIKAARELSGYWADELLCTDQHPILQWVKERLLMLMKRGECPHVTSRNLEPGELCFCFIGQISSRAGVPITVDAHAISFRHGGGFEHRSLEEALDAAGFKSLMNDGKERNTASAEVLIPSAVEASLKHMRELGVTAQDSLLGPLRVEERRLKKWSTNRRDLLEGRIEQHGDKHPKTRTYRNQLDDMERYIKDRKENWLNTYFNDRTEPSTQLVLVIEGAK